MAFGRNLSASEILDQALHFRRKEPVDHVVFMGMGEPLLNLDGVLGACERLPEIGIHPSSTTISTVGWIPGIERLAERDGPTIRLALSLHAPDDALRSELMPVNDRYPLADVLDACRRWHEARKRKVYVEYLMLSGVNDSYEQALALAAVLEPRGAFKVNLIPYNPTDFARGAQSDRPGGAQRDRRSREHRTRLSSDEHRTRFTFEGSTREAIATFRKTLEGRGVPATVRLTRGRDIHAACGQLAVSAAAR